MKRHRYDPTCVAVWIVAPILGLAVFTAILKAVLR